MIINVNQQTDPPASEDKLLIELPYANIPTPSGRLAKGVYYPLKNKQGTFQWISIMTVLRDSILELIGLNSITNVNAVAPLKETTTAGTATITTSMSSGKLIGRGTAGVGVMEEITIGSNLSLSGNTLNATGGVVIVTFTAIAGQQDYTVADVPDLANIVGLSLKFVSDDSSILTSAFRSWDDITFSIINVTVAGGEEIVIFAS